LPNDDLTNTPIGVFRAVVRPTYDEIVRDQIAKARQSAAEPEAELSKLLNGGDTWTIL
jgi:2-oxoglutarate ferredoxin oxidoreductase subunit beta